MWDYDPYAPSGHKGSCSFVPRSEKSPTVCRKTGWHSGSAALNPTTFRVRVGRNEKQRATCRITATINRQRAACGSRPDGRTRLRPMFTSVQFCISTSANSSSANSSSANPDFGQFEYGHFWSGQFRPVPPYRPRTPENTKETTREGGPNPEKVGA